MFVEIAVPAIVMQEQQLCGIYMGQSLQCGSRLEKGVGASWLTAQACSFYAGVKVAVGHVLPRGSWCAQAAPALRIKDG